MTRIGVVFDSRLNSLSFRIIFDKVGRNPKELVLAPMIMIFSCIYYTVKSSPVTAFKVVYS